MANKGNSILDSSKKIVIVILTLSLLGPTIIELLYYIGDNFDIVFSRKFNIETMLDYYGTALSAIATLLLGGIVLWQNKRFKDENDKSQRFLNNSVNELAKSNKSMEIINRELLILEKSTQKIQLLLAQEYIPFLSFEGISNITQKKYPAPSRNKFSVKSTKPIRRDVTFSFGKFEQVSTFELEIVEHKVLLEYAQLKFEINLSNKTKSKLSKVQIEKIRLFTGGEKEKLFVFDKLKEEGYVVERLAIGDLIIFNVSILCSDDYRYLFDKNIEITFNLKTSTGLDYRETITIEDIKRNDGIVKYDFKEIDQD